MAGVDDDRGACVPGARHAALRRVHLSICTTGCPCRAAFGNRSQLKNHRTPLRHGGRAFSVSAPAADSLSTRTWSGCGASSSASRLALRCWGFWRCCCTVRMAHCGALHRRARPGHHLLPLVQAESGHGLTGRFQGAPNPSCRPLAALTGRNLPCRTCRAHSLGNLTGAVGIQASSDNLVRNHTLEGCWSRRQPHAHQRLAHAVG